MGQTSAKGTTHYSTKFGPLQGPNDKLRKLTLSTCFQHVDVNSKQYSPLWCVQPSAANTCTMYTNAFTGVIHTILANMMQYRITPLILPHHPLVGPHSSIRRYAPSLRNPSTYPSCASCFSLSELQMTFPLSSILFVSFCALRGLLQIAFKPDRAFCSPYPSEPCPSSSALPPKPSPHPFL